MKKVALVSLLSVLTLAGPAWAGDAAAGKAKATACIACHGSESFGGIFYTLQLAGRDADKLTIKTNKYKTGKILHPVMNLAVSFFSEKEIEDISAYYQSLGKPAVTSPFFTIKGDDDAATSSVSAPAAAPAGGNWVAHRQVSEALE
jgi:cytochrome c553